MFIPSPPHLAVAATFIVHPSTTTRAKTAEEKEAPSAALRLLRLTNALVGPITARFDIAFAFTHFESSRQGNRRRREDESPGGYEVLDETKLLNLELGQSSAVWSRAEDFWHAVGWAFNTSVLHPERWECWQLWLEFMCEVLENDWAERGKQLERENGEAGDGEKQQEKRQRWILEQSLIFGYIQGSSAGYGRDRRILRAIFADGTSSSVNEFREVFRNELKPLKRDQENNIKKREAEVNIDEEQYGDYLTKDEDEDEEDAVARESNNNTPSTSERRPKRTRRGTKADQPATTTPATTASSALHYAHGVFSLLGGLPSLSLRQRLLHLLSAVSEALPQSFLPLDELYHLFVENIRHLPLPIYQSFISPHASTYFSPAAQTILCESLLYRLRESIAAPEAEDERNLLNQSKLQRCYLPYAASTASVVDNTRISMALEALLAMLADSDLLRITEKLREAVLEGIEARAEKAQEEVRRNQVSREAESMEWSWLLESGDRLLFMMNELLPHMQGQTS